MSRRLVIALAGIAMLAAAPAPLLAQAKAPPPKAAPSKAKVEAAVFRLRVIVSAFQSDKVAAPIKDALFGCMYENSMQKISDAVDKVIAANPGKIKPNDPTQMLGVIAGTCGYKPPPAAAKPPVKK